MMIRTCLSVLVGAFLLPACLGNEADNDVGTVDLRLTGQAPSGAIYRLRDADLSIAGAGAPIVLHTEDDPTRTQLSAHLVSGPYALALSEAWRLERVTATGAAPVTGTLLSPNPQPFEIRTGERTPLELRFLVNREEVPMGEGDLDVSVGFEEVPPPPACGDSVCNGDETCGSCAQDCGACPPPPPACGDSVCNGDETCGSCAQDCGACPPPPPACGDSVCNGDETCGSCAQDCGVCACQPGDCTGSDVCIGEVCTPAFGRAYRISVIAMTVAGVDQSGQLWDVDGSGGAPDPFVEVRLNGALVFQTAVGNNTYTPAFTGGATVTVPAGANLTFTGWDDDAFGQDDEIMSCVYSPLSADAFRSFRIRCEGTGTERGTVIELGVAPL